MSLLLTSDGIYPKPITEFFISLLPKPPHECAALMLSNSKTPEQQVYEEEAKNELAHAGITDVLVFNLNDAAFTARKQYDVIYVCGGNTFDILNNMKKTGVYEFVEKRMNTVGLLYVGVSAGSIIAGPNITIAGHGSTSDPNDINLADLESLRLTDITILPHFKPHMQSEAEAFQKQTPFSVQVLQDGEALFIAGSEKKIIR